MIKRLILFLLVSNGFLLYAQTVKTDVLVVGGGVSGIAAAMQCARSKVKTILADGEVKPESSTSGGTPVTLDADNNIPSGLWSEFSKRLKEHYKNTAGYDSSHDALKYDLNTENIILKNIADTVKNLTLYPAASFTTIKRDGDRWEVSIVQNGKTIIIKARVIVDATENGAVASKAGATFFAGFDSHTDNGGSTLYRTSIGVGETQYGQEHQAINIPENNYPPYPFYNIPMNAVLVKGADNILCTGKALSGDSTIQYLPLQLELGQGAGAVAAYCAFFKTTTKNLRVRIIQGELLDFKSCLVPFTDITEQDPDWRAIQQVGATGLLKGTGQTNNSHPQFVFMPDSLVATDEIKQGLIEIYTRAFLWFSKEKPGEKFTVGNTLSFISDYTLTDSQVLQTSLQKAWKTQYKFKLDFDLNRQITRREFAVLANRFLNPFARTVELSGRLMN
jgi:hypothetical protein